MTGAVGGKNRVVDRFVCNCARCVVVHVEDRGGN